MSTDHHDANRTRKWIRAGAVSVLALTAGAPAAYAQVETSGEGDIIVTGTRRSVSVQDVPINISAVGAEELEANGIEELGELLQIVPGAHLIDMGGRDANRIIVRGLNSSPLGSSEGVGNTAGGTVATYVGDIPLYVDLALNDMDRVEVLLGPQGTLYGAGTLGGAIRYIPRRPQLEESSIAYRGEAYQYSEADDLSNEFGMTGNIPIGSNAALRFSIDRSEDSGFIDQPYLVDYAALRESIALGATSPGQSFPNVLDPSDPRYSLHRENDTNWEDVISGRVAFRWAPTTWLDGTLTYYYQDHNIGGRQISSMRSTVPAGEYENAKRVLEPNHRRTELLALEWTADLGFAELTSATGTSWYDETGQRDQTDLLIGLDYLSYFEFPQFTSFTREYAEEETTTAELRLVSKGDGPLNWIIGGFYNTVNNVGVSSEYTPGFEDFGFGGNVRNDDLEFYSIDYEALEEQAIFGEIGYDITSRWSVTLGGRWYKYDLVTDSASTGPIFATFIYLDDPTDPDGYPDGVLRYDLETASQSDEGSLYKFNTSYDFTDDFMGYLTVSEGYRIGGSNGVAPCPTPLNPGQNLCGLPDELAYEPDSTTNYEVGVRTQWFDGRLTLNAAAYFIEWEGAQVDSATVNGLLPITKNSDGAVSRGLEVNFSADLTDNWNVRGSYANTSAQLSADAFALVSTIDPAIGAANGQFFEDAFKGDRLPGFAQHQASLFTSYTLPMANGLEWEFSLGANYLSEVLTRTGGRGGGITLPSYTVADAAIRLGGDNWSATLYANNIFDEFYETGAVSTPLSNQIVFTDADGDPVYYRTHYTSVGAPRRIGVRLSYEFGG